MAAEFSLRKHDRLGAFASEATPTDNEVRMNSRPSGTRTCSSVRAYPETAHIPVESVLAGEQDRLKELVIGIDVFDRRPNYDPKIDSREVPPEGQRGSR